MILWSNVILLTLMKMLDTTPSSPPPPTPSTQIVQLGEFIHRKRFKSQIKSPQDYDRAKSPKLISFIFVLIPCFVPPFALVLLPKVLFRMHTHTEQSFHICGKTSLKTGVKKNWSVTENRLWEFSILVINGSCLCLKCFRTEF